MSLNTSPVLVLGAGSWGTALAIHIARTNRQVYLWGRNSAVLNEIEKTKENKRYLPGVTLPRNLSCETNLDTALDVCTDVLCVVPSEGFREMMQNLSAHAKKPIRLASATKGFDKKNLMLQHEVVTDIFSKAQPFAIFSGPSFAKELAKGLPTAMVVSANTLEYAAAFRDWLHHDQVRLYINDDIIGTQIGGACKNIYAIAAGISDGLGFGANARAALITRSLAEMNRLALAMGAREETLMGLSGIGDLILTATDSQSRNRRFGLGLGQGKTETEVKKEIGQVVEGISCSQLVLQLAKKYKVEMPIAEEIAKVLAGEITATDAVASFFNRDPKLEFTQ